MSNAIQIEVRQAHFTGAKKGDGIKCLVANAVREWADAWARLPGDTKDAGVYVGPNCASIGMETFLLCPIGQALVEKFDRGLLTEDFFEPRTITLTPGEP